MKRDSILRLSFITADGQAQTFQKNLCKLIYVVLYDNSEPLCTYEIATKIKDDYDLVFLEEEINEILQNSKYKRDFIELDNKRFYLSPAKCDSLKNIEKRFNIESILHKYIKENSANITYEYLLEIIKEFLYKTFNLNKKAIFCLIDKSNNSIIEQVDISNDKKTIINDFLNWENIEKDIFVFNTISFCVDYCQLTIKKDSKTFNSIFNGKSFYLDTNIILRMIGFDNDVRKNVMHTFIERCKDCGITIKYTNFTYKEIEETIKSYIKGLKESFKGRRPINLNNYEYFSSGEKNTDFIKLYLSWCQMPNNKYSDYNGFKDYLMKLIDKTLKGFQVETLTTYAISDKDNFNNMCLSLKEHKQKYGKSCTQLSVKTDVNNFMHLMKVRHNERGSNGFDIKNYLITVDTKLCDWTSEAAPSVLPICTLPTVWHSLMLKYKGRTENDYKAFCRFLNMSYKIEDDPISDKKARILAIVTELDESVDIKNKILDGIRRDIINSESVSINDEYEIVEEKQNEIISREIALMQEKYGKAYDESKLRMLNDFAEKDARKIIKRNQNFAKIFKIIHWIFWVFVLSLVVYLFVFHKWSDFFIAFSNKDYGFDFTHYIAIIELIFLAIYYVVIKPINSHINKQTFESLIEKRKRKLIKRYSNENN